MSEKYNWKGKFVTKKKYQRLSKLKENAEKLREKRASLKPTSEESTSSCNNLTSNCPVLGDRIINLGHMSKEMVCSNCKKELPLSSITGERMCGLGSFFKAKCGECNNLQVVESGPLHEIPGTSKHKFQVNSKLPIGAMSTGIGYTQVNKLCSYVLDMTSLSKQTYKDDERVVGPFIEQVAKESCVHAVELERAYTLNNLEKLKKMLPPDTPDDFLCYKKIINDKEVEIVRLFASFDFGWSQRSNGYSYDSLNGYGCLIGMQTGMVLDYATLNRKCRQCDSNEKNNTTKDHDCRLNFHGSAKSMEAAGARLLVIDSTILKDANVEIGVFIADNDSSSISAIQKASSYIILKQSDMNHTKKGVGNLLHSINSKNKDPDRELKNDSIKTLQKYFSYAVKQNVGNLDEMKAALKNIPNHAFGHHEDCGSWCKANVEKENYVGLQLKNSVLYEELKSIFAKLADNASKFLMAASSQANESINNSMCSKAPKRTCYSTSESSDYRFAITIAQKNYTESFIASIFHALNLQSTMNLANRIQQINKSASKRKLRETKIESKRLRLELKQNRSQLKYRKEKSEGLSYSSNMTLFDQQPTSITVDNPSGNENHVEFTQQCDTLKNAFVFENDDTPIVFFDLETGGFDMFKDEVLQICMKCGPQTFKSYITPTRSINHHSSEVHNLTKINTNLFKNGKQVPTLAKAVVVSKVLEFLKGIGKKCIMVAHNCQFDSRRLIILVQSCDLLNEYKEVILGFTDTLPLFKKKVSNMENYKLTTLASSKLAISCSDAHDAEFDVKILEKLAETYFNLDDLITINETFADVVNYIENKKRSKSNKCTFLPLKEEVSKGMLQKLSESNFSYQDLVEAYKVSRENAEILLQRKVDRKATLIKTQSIRNKILDHLKSTIKE